MRFVVVCVFVVALLVDLWLLACGFVLVCWYYVGCAVVICVVLVFAGGWLVWMRLVWGYWLVVTVVGCGCVGWFGLLFMHWIRLLCVCLD